MNEKRAAAPEEKETEPNVPRTRSDVAPKGKVQIGSGAPPRLSSGLRPAVQIPPPPVVDLREEELVDESWDDESGPTLFDAHAAERAQADADAEPEFSFDDFPTRQAVAPLIPMPEPEPSTPETAPPVFSADETAQMPNAPLRRIVDLELPDLPEPPSVSRSPYVPITMSGTPMPPPANVRNAFLQALSPNDDPPLKKLALVTLVAFLSTLAVAAFVTWIAYLIRH